MEKDYSLLRPFDLEAAKRGEKFAFVRANGLEQRKFIAGPDSIGTIIIQDKRGMFQESGTYPYVMEPLAWVEGRPVYRGDVLYFNSEGSAIFGPVVIESEKNEMILVTFKDKFRCNLDVSKLTWQKPKTKREGWVETCYYKIHSSREEAEKQKSMGTKLFFATWEE